MIPQWTVRTPHRTGLAVFEDWGSALAAAAEDAGAESPSVITEPGRGISYLVFREHPDIEISTRHKYVGTTRRIVEVNR